MQRIVVIGAGHMGAILIGGIRKNLADVALSVVEADQDHADALREWLGVDVRPDYSAAPGDLVILAIPPQAFEDFATGQGPRALTGVTVTSVMAGVSLATLREQLGTPAVVRAMPNVAAEVGQSMTVMCLGPEVPPRGAALAEKAMACVGQVLIVTDESLLDAATAISGGGPGIISYLADAFTDFAAMAGFSAEQALLMTCQVLRGTADLLETRGGDPEQVYRQVMTPGGTTERGIRHLAGHDVHDALVDALEQSALRAHAISEGR